MTNNEIYNYIKTINYIDDKIKNILTVCLFLSISFSALGAIPLPVNNPDIPDNGWYWAAFDGGKAGWAINFEIQTADFAPSGHFIFGAFYTYDENEQPIWYTVSGNYEPNPDVHAWREGRGNMGTFTGDILKSSGGACLVCIPKASDTVVNAGLGLLTITWTNPYQAVVQIGANTTHNVSRFEYHSGLSAENKIDFITEGWWQVYYQSLGGTSIIDTYRAAKGLVKFSEIDKSFFSGSTFYDENFKYYIQTDDNSIYWILGQGYGFASLVTPSRNIIIVFNPETNLSMLFYFTGWSEQELSQPSVRGHGLSDQCSVVVEGYFRPSLNNSVFYGRQDDRCTLSDLADVNDARGSFAYINYVGNAGDALINNDVIADFSSN